MIKFNMNMSVIIQSRKSLYSLPCCEKYTGGKRTVTTGKLTSRHFELRCHLCEFQKENDIQIDKVAECIWICLSTTMPNSQW
jgi:hypothetical protein